MSTLLENMKIVRAADSAAAAQTDVTSDVIDRRGFERVTFLALLGDITSGGSVTMTLYTGDASDGAGAAAVDGMTATTDDTGSDGVLALELHRPAGSYVHVVIARDDQNTVVDGVVCILSEARQVPVTQDGILDSVTA